MGGESSTDRQNREQKERNERIEQARQREYAQKIQREQRERQLEQERQQRQKEIQEKEKALLKLQEDQRKKLQYEDQQKLLKEQEQQRQQRQQQQQLQQQQLEAQFNKLTGEIQILKENDKKFDQQLCDLKQNLKSQNFECEQNENHDFYHQQILFKSLAELKSGIKVQCTFDDDYTIKQIKSQKNKILSLVGNFNSGKTWILGKLTQKSFKRGLNVRTEGLNIYYGQIKLPQNKENDQNREKICFIDTAGSGEPIQTYSNYQNLIKNYEEQLGEDEEEEEKKQEIQNDNLKEKLIEIEINKVEILKNIISSERFIYNFMLDQSSIILVVVGIMTLEDERVINGIIEEFKKKTDGKLRMIIVIHNFYNFSDIAQVESQIEKDIKNNFEVEQRDDRPIYHQFLGEDFKNCPIAHIVIARDKTKAGTHYNDYAFEFIDQEIEAHKAKTEEKNFVQCLKQYLQDNLKLYINFQRSQISENSDQNNNNTQSLQEQQTLSQNDKLNDDLEQNKIIQYGEDSDLGLIEQQTEDQQYQTLIISQKLQQFNKIIFQNLTFNHFGQVDNFYQDKHIPPYQIYQQKKEKEICILVLILFPGLDQDQIEKLRSQSNFETISTPFSIDFQMKGVISYKPIIRQLFQKYQISEEEEDMKLRCTQLRDKEFNLYVKLINKSDYDSGLESSNPSVQIQNGFILVQIQFLQKKKKFTLAGKK